MLYDVRITSRANRQFQSICEYLAVEFGESVADAFEREVDKMVTALRRFPESGHLESFESRYTYRSRIIGKINKMYYFVHEQTIVIAAFADMRMHPDNIRREVTGK